MVDNREWLGAYSHARLPARHRQALHVPLHAGQGLRPAAPWRRACRFTEFSYMTLQAADFLHLYRDRGVEMQMGGADQWGNITAGLELIRRVVGREEGDEPPAFGLCSPLLLTARRREDGQVASGRGVPGPDADVAVRLLPVLAQRRRRARAAPPALADAAAPRAGSTALEAQQAAHPERAPGAARARLRPDRARPRPRGGRAPGAGRRGGLRRRADRRSRGAGRAARACRRFRLQRRGGARGPGAVLVGTGLYPSNAEARRAIAQGGLRVNGERVSVAETPLPALVAGEWLVVRQGKRAVRVGRLRP